MNIGTCRKCNKRIIMAKHKTTRNFAPIEVDPSPDGNISVTGDEYEIVPEEERETYRQRGFPLRKNHFATCAFAKNFAKKIAARKKTKAASAAKT